MTSPVETATEKLDADDVVRMIGSDAADNGFTREVILEKLRNGDGKEKIAVDYWENVASRAATLVDVSEAGSSRSLSQIRKNALEMAGYWRKLGGLEEGDVPKVRRSVVRRIERA